ncbi:LOW QUALITY PROTEIN: ankyrin repeat domain-containing protein SOWAHB [Pterocles gutturalis]
MARELSQEAVLDFLWAAGGRAPNTALLRHFHRFLRDPALTEQQRRERREYFKSLVNSLATVQPAAVPGASKDIVLRRRYRDLLDEDLPPPEEQPQQEEKEPPPPPRRDPDRRRGPPGEPAEKGRRGGGHPHGAAVAGGCAARGGPCCECRRARRAAAPPAGPRGAPPPRAAPLPLAAAAPCSAPPVPDPAAVLGPWAPHPAGPPRYRPPGLPSDPGVLTPAGPPRSRSPPLPPGPPPPYQTLPPPSATPSRCRSPPLSPTGPPPHQTLQPPAVPPSRCRSPPLSPTGLPPHQTLQPPAARPSRCQSPPLSPTGPPPHQTLQPPAARPSRCQSPPLPPGPGVQGIPSSLLDDGGQQLRSMPSKSSFRNVPSRGLSVPLGRREHAWLVAVSAGCWAQVRGLFLEEPELALQRDFMSGFTVLHWLAKHGDGPGLQELAVAARQAGLTLDVDARSGCGYTPLHLAAIHGHQLVIKVLVLQLGCQVQVRDSSGRRPWEYLGSSTSGEIWQLLEAPRGTIMFPTQPLARSVSSVSKVSPSTGRAALPACLRPQHGRRAASHRAGSESD